MRPLILACAAFLPAASAAEPVIAPAPSEAMPVIDPSLGARKDCPPISRYHAMRRGGPLAAQKLNELPMADHYKAAYRKIDGCEAPIIASFGVGATR